MSAPFLGSVATCLLLFAPEVLQAQAAGAPPAVATVPSDAVATPTQNPRGPEQGDAVLATWLLTRSRNEVVLAGLAQQLTKTAETRRFAQEVLDAHSRLVRQLQPFADAAQPGYQGPGQVPGLPGDRPPARAANPGEGNAGRASGPASSFDHLALLREVEVRSLASDTQLFRDLAGAGFDRFYASIQVGALTRTIDLVEVFGTCASASLRGTLAAALPPLRADLERAKALARSTVVTAPAPAQVPAGK